MDIGRTSIELHIEELVLHGFAAADRRAIGAAVEAELTRLLASRGLPASLADGATIRAIDAGRVAVPGDARPANVGVQVAQSVYGGLSE